MHVCKPTVESVIKLWSSVCFYQLKIFVRVCLLFGLCGVYAILFHFVYETHHFMHSSVSLFYSRLIGNPIKELSGETFMHNTHLEAL